MLRARMVEKRAMSSMGVTPNESPLERWRNADRPDRRDSTTTRRRLGWSDRRADRRSAPATAGWRPPPARARAPARRRTASAPLPQRPREPVIERHRARFGLGLERSGE